MNLISIHDVSVPEDIEVLSEKYIRRFRRLNSLLESHELLRFVHVEHTYLRNSQFHWKNNSQVTKQLIDEFLNILKEKQVNFQLLLITEFRIDYQSPEVINLTFDEFGVKLDHEFSYENNDWKLSCGKWKTIGDLFSNETF